MNLYIRENYLRKIRGFYHSDDIIKVITGVRRCGKSSIMMMIADELKASHINEENIIYIDLDKRGYKNIKKAEELENLIERYQYIHGLKYLFIDEIQNVSGFEEVLNSFRTEGNWSIFITGSNSYLLSGEIMTKLTGRYIEFEMFPLSFEEYEGMKKFYGKNIDVNPYVELNNYIREGGFPRTIFLDSLLDKETYVQEVVREIFEKDIRRRLKIRNKDIFETIRHFVIGNFGVFLSINNIYKELKNNGMKIAKETISRYINALLKAKIIYECPRFDMKSKRALLGERKYYLSDFGFLNASNVDGRIFYGPALENIVYIYAKTHDYQISVGRIGNFECDFILRDKEMNYSYAQVAYTILSSKTTEDREYRPLEMIKDNYPKYVITTDYLLQKRNGIHHVNLMDFILSNGKF